MESPSDLHVPVFLRTLYRLAMDDSVSQVGWNEDGSVLEIRDVKSYEAQVLPEHFTTAKFSSFLRSLGYYGVSSHSFSHFVVIHAFSVVFQHADPLGHAIWSSVFAMNFAQSTAFSAVISNRLAISVSLYIIGSHCLCSRIAVLENGPKLDARCLWEARASCSIQARGEACMQ